MKGTDVVADPDLRSETGRPALSTGARAERFPWVGMLALAAAAFLA